MKKNLFINFVLTVLSVSVLSAQSLPPVAQALYNEAYNHDSAQVSFALSHGAQVLATPDGNSFYLQWFPVSTVKSATPLIITLHGSDGYAFAEFYNWYSYAVAHGCGIIALQWFRGIAAMPPADYFTDTALYTYIDTALTRFSYPSHRAFLHGFSRGAARSYAMAFLDAHGGKNYFCTILSNSGSAQSTYPLYADINAGIYGANVFAGKRWTLFCGGLDPDPAQSGCVGMSGTKTWLQSKGASVGIFIQDDTLGHAGFHTIPAYMDSVLDYYTSCFDGAVSVPQISDIAPGTKIFPNPFWDNISIQVQQGNFSRSSFIIRNMVGVALFAESDTYHTGSFTKNIDLSFLSPGMYLLEVKIDGISEKKVVIKQ